MLWLRPHLSDRRLRLSLGLCLAISGVTGAGCSRDPHAQMLKYVKSGDAYAAEGKLPEAIIEYRNAIQKESRAADVRVKLAEAYMRQGEPAKALEEYVRAADVLPDAATQLKAGHVLLLARRFDDAKGRAEKALAVDGRNVEAQILLANALAGLKNLDGAVAELEAAIQMNPERSATYANLGTMEFGRGHKDAAERAFKRAVELSPGAADARLALASFYWATSRMADAERELDAALAAEPGNPLAHRTAATFFLVTDRPEAAEQHLRRHLELTKSPAAALALADFYIAQNKETAARQLLEPIGKDSQTAGAANLRLAALDQAAGRSAEASARVEAILQAEPAQLSALLMKSGFLLREHKVDEAVIVAQKATQAHADSPAAFSALGRAQMARKDRSAAITAYEEAVRLNPLATDAKVALSRLALAAGRVESSTSLAEEVLKAQPQNAEARLLLVKSLISRGDTGRAQTELQALSTRFPDSAPVHVQQGMLFGRKQQPEQARREFERALELQPDSLEATGGLVAIDLSTRRVDAARARVDALIAQPGARPAAVMLAARTYAALGDLKTSEQLLRRILAGDPSHLAAYGALGQLYAKQGRLDAALVEFDALAARDPKPVSALTLSGMILDAQGKRAAARERFERVMKLDASAPVAANNLAWIYAQSDGNLDVALNLAQTAQRKLPDTPEVSDTLGFIYYRKGLLPQAIRELRSAVEADGNNPGYRYHLGLALAKSGDSAGATEHLRRALALKSDFEGASDARALLATLGS
jgi:tetratricopeptide (TPR) repeat protein